MDYQVRLSRSARADIEELVRYISIDDSEQALRFGRFLIRHAKSLSQLPERLPTSNEKRLCYSHCLINKG
jgi:plasmid stabilization system protein ParE